MVDHSLTVHERKRVADLEHEAGEKILSSFNIDDAFFCGPHQDLQTCVAEFREDHHSEGSIGPCVPRAVTFLNLFPVDSTMPYLCHTGMEDHR